MAPSRNKTRLLLFSLYVLSALWSAATSAGLQQFQASWEESRWTLDAAPGRCALTHTIPRFGEARFEQKSGYRLQFSLHADQPLTRDASARLYAQAPPWRHHASRHEMGEFPFRQGKVPMQLGDEKALQIYSQLEQGMQPVIAFAERGEGGDEVQIALQPVRFRAVLPQFLACTASLMYLDFEPVAEHDVRFATNSVRLSRAARRVLEQVARDYRSNGKLRIVLGGHADARGKPEYNMALSRRRARMVSRYLQSRGVPARVIASRYFGDTRPKDPGNDSRAWAENRRVTIWLTQGQDRAG